MITSLPLIAILSLGAFAPTSTLDEPTPIERLATASARRGATARRLRISGAIVLAFGSAASLVGTTLFFRSWSKARAYDVGENVRDDMFQAGLGLAAIGGPLTGAGAALYSVGATTAEGQTPRELLSFHF